jgi:drug/metabolite transporter (DMT)-like permease
VDIQISLDYGLTLLAALLVGTGFVLQQNAAQPEPDSRFLSLRLILDLFHKPRWLLGIGCMVAGQILAAWSIGNLPLAFVEPLLTTNLVFALLVAVPIAKATLRFWEIAGAVVLCCGVALLSVSRSAKPIGLSFGSFSHWPAAAAIAFIAFVCVQVGRRHPGRTRAILTGTAAGLIFGIQDALTRQTLQAERHFGFAGLFLHWPPYALVGAGALGIVLMQSAFSSGPLNVSLPAISAGEPVVGILLGVVVFGDRVQDTPGELAIYTGGLAALVVGVVMVSRSPALSHLRAWTEEGIASLPPLPTLPHVPTLPLNLPGLHGTRAEGDADTPDGPAGEDMTQRESPPLSPENARAARRWRFRRPSRPVSDLRGLLRRPTPSRTGAPTGPAPASSSPSTRRPGTQAPFAPGHPFRPRGTPSARGAPLPPPRYPSAERPPALPRQTSTSASSSAPPRSSGRHRGPFESPEQPWTHDRGPFGSRGAPNSPR